MFFLYCNYSNHIYVFLYFLFKLVRGRFVEVEFLEFVEELKNITIILYIYYIYTILYYIYTILHILLLYIYIYMCICWCPYECFNREEVAEVCELVGTYILNLLKETFQHHSVGLYRDYGLAVVTDLSGPEIERMKKRIIKIFKGCLTQN